MMPAAASAVGVTGASGFVGRAVCEGLRERGHPVRPLVRRMTGNTDEAVVGNIDGQTPWKSALKDLQVVIHCAAHVHQMGADADHQARTYHQVNTEGTLQLARCAAEAGVHRLLFISTVKVLGERTQPGQPFRHDSTPQPSDPYGQSKWAAEQGLRRIEADTGLEVVVIRPPLVYGAGVGANFAALVRLVGSGWPLPLGAIRNQRSMVGLRNLVDLICHAGFAPAAGGQTLLASDGEDLSTPQLIRRIALAMKRPARVWGVPPGLLRLGAHLVGRSDQMERLTGSLQVDISRTREILNWTPPYRVDDELRLTVAPFAGITA